MKSPYPGSVGTTPDSIGGAVQAEPPDTDETSCPRCGESHDLAKVKGCIKCCNVFTVTDHGRRGRVTCGGDTLATMHLQSAHTSTRWVFVRHSECIQVSTRELSVTIDGPHRTRS